jgi:very-short-patch-repair endonuclease
MPNRRDHDLRLQEFARDMRKAPSEAEREMWRILRRKKIDGFRFRRQYPIAGYIADFVCLSANLIIEVDGGQHGEEAAQKYDERRTSVLNEDGFRVLRFWAHEVLKYREAVFRTVWRELHQPQEPPP